MTRGAYDATTFYIAMAYRPGALAQAHLIHQ